MQIGGKSVAEAGCVPILRMREFQKTGRLPDSLVTTIEAGVSELSRQ
jgi:hypothetical protein